MASSAESFTVRVHLFARAKELAGGASAIEVELRAGSTVADAKAAVVSLVPALGELLGTDGSGIALNADFADLSDIIHGGDELAILPPVSGG